ncbi:MAG: type II toxin-antitoxin system HicA family toxin [Thermoguttaceae bacterium]|nr:type II toxin-antitoxin system HicA family toxin [Thermoguttaceae bacterium]
MKAFEIVRILKRNGWSEKHCEGSHHQFEHKETREKRTFAFHDEREEVGRVKQKQLEKDFKLKFKR